MTTEPRSARNAPRIRSGTAVVLILALLVTLLVVAAPAQRAAAVTPGGLYTATIIACLQNDGVPPIKPGHTNADANLVDPNAVNDGVTMAHELHLCIMASPALPKYGRAASQSNPQEWPPMGSNTRIQDPNKRFHGLFVGTDGSLPVSSDTGSELRPCQMETAVKKWPGWSDPNQDRVLVLDESRSPSQCKSNGPATEQMVVSRLAFLKQKVLPGDEFVFYFAGHGGCVAGTNAVILDDWNKAVAPYDGLLTGAELAQYLSGFAKDVTITVIIDSCYSGRILNDLINSAITDANGIVIDPGNLSILTAADKNSFSYGYPRGFASCVGIDQGVVFQGKAWDQYECKILPGLDQNFQTSAIGIGVGAPDQQPKLAGAPVFVCRATNEKAVGTSGGTIKNVEQPPQLPHWQLWSATFTQVCKGPIDAYLQGALTNPTKPDIRFAVFGDRRTTVGGLFADFDAAGPSGLGAGVLAAAIAGAFALAGGAWYARRRRLQ